MNSLQAETRKYPILDESKEPICYLVKCGPKSTKRDSEAVRCVRGEVRAIHNERNAPEGKGGSYSEAVKCGRQ